MHPIADEQIFVLLCSPFECRLVAGLLAHNEIPRLPENLRRSVKWNPSIVARFVIVLSEPRDKMGAAPVQYPLPTVAVDGLLHH